MLYLVGEVGGVQPTKPEQMFSFVAVYRSMFGAYKFNNEIVASNYDKALAIAEAMEPVHALDELQDVVSVGYVG